jgi:hypothetical protein
MTERLNSKKLSEHMNMKTARKIYQKFLKRCPPKFNPDGVFELIAFAYEIGLEAGKKKVKAKPVEAK